MATHISICIPSMLPELEPAPGWTRVCRLQVRPDRAPPGAWLGGKASGRGARLWSETFKCLETCRPKKERSQLGLPEGKPEGLLSGTVIHAKGQSSSWPLQADVLFLVSDLSHRCSVCLGTSFPGLHTLTRDALDTVHLRLFLPGGQSPRRRAPPARMPVEAACWHPSAQRRPLWWEEVDNSQL